MLRFPPRHSARRPNPLIRDLCLRLKRIPGLANSRGCFKRWVLRRTKRFRKKIPASVEAPVRPVTPLPPEAMRPQSRPEPPPKPKIATPTPGAPASPGEFTRLFQSPVSAASTPPPRAKKDAPANPLATTPPLTGQPPGSDPHEFTRLFQTPAQPSVAEHRPTAGSPGAAVPKPKPESGEFTRFFGGGSPAPHPHGLPLPEVQRPLSPQNAATPPQSPGEFTQLFSGQKMRILSRLRQQRLRTR